MKTNKAETKNQSLDYQKPLEERFKVLFSLLKGVKHTGDNKAQAFCPAHKNTQTPALTLNLTPEKINIQCQSQNCSIENILSVIGLKTEYLYLNTYQSHQATIPKRKETIYQYHDLKGKIIYECVKYDNPKEFKYRENKSKWNLSGVELIPYNLPDVNKTIKQDGLIIFVEGEKDATNGNKLDIVCTTIPLGAGKWKDEYEQYFKDANLMFVPDNDKPGRAGALKIANKLKKIAKSIIFLHLPVKEKGDLSNWIEAGGSKSKFLNLIKVSSMSLEETEIVYELNKKHAVINVQGKVVIMNEFVDPHFKRQDINFSSRTDFISKYENKLIFVSDGEKIKKKSFGQVWLKSSARRQFEGLHFDPAENKAEGFYNLWRGFAYEAQKGDCSLYYHHINEVLAQNNTEIYDYILNWMADAIQNPTRQKGGVAFVLRGGQGAGKGTVINTFGKIFGQHFLSVSNAKHIVGSFNAHLKDCLILFADEAFYAGDKKHESILKTLITEPTRPVEYKGKDVQILPNYTRLMMASNKSWVAPLELDDRRFFILDISNKKAKNHQYFDAIYKQMENGGHKALLFDLQNRDLSKVDIRNIPQTQAILDNKISSLDSVSLWIYTLLQEGTIEEKSGLLISELYEDYKKSCNKNPESQITWSKTIRKYLPHLKRYQDNTGKRHYNLGTLEKARETFENMIKTKIDWNE